MVSGFCFVVEKYGDEGKENDEEETEEGFTSAFTFFT